MALDQGLYYLPVDSAWTLVRNDGYIIVVEDTVWNLHLQGGGGGGGSHEVTLPGHVTRQRVKVVT